MNSDQGQTTEGRWLAEIGPVIGSGGATKLDKGAAATFHCVAAMVFGSTIRDACVQNYDVHPYERSWWPLLFSKQLKHKSIADGLQETS